MTPLSRSSRRTLLYVVDLLRGGFSGRVTLTCSQGGVRSVKVRRSYLRESFPCDLSDATKATLRDAADILREGFSGELVFDVEGSSIDDLYDEIVMTPKELDPRQDVAEAIQ